MAKENGIVLSGVSIMELTKNNRLLIENHKGVKAYCADCVQVYVSYGLVEICGCNLHFDYMTCNRMLIQGTISRITLLQRSGNEN